jgi:hypothetical protein
MPGDKLQFLQSPVDCTEFVEVEMIQNEIRTTETANPNILK